MELFTKDLIHKLMITMELDYLSHRFNLSM